MKKDVARQDKPESEALEVSQEIKDGFKTEVIGKVRRHLESLNNWREKSHRCARIY